MPFKEKPFAKSGILLKEGKALNFIMESIQVSVDIPDFSFEDSPEKIIHVPLRVSNCI